MDEIKDLLAIMRDCGVVVGMGTHLPEVVEYCEEHAWDIDFYMTCFYSLSRDRPGEGYVASGGRIEESYDDADREIMCEVIRATPKPCLAFKILAASRKCATPECVRAAFEYAFSHIKPTDAVVVGMYQGEANQVAMNAGIAAELLG